MIYRVIGIMSGSSLDGLDMAFVELHENAGKWSFDIICADCYNYTPEWKEKLRTAVSLNAMEYQLLHTEFGHYISRQVNRFIGENDLHYKVALIASHGHTTFHMPHLKMTAQLGDGAAIAAGTNLPVVTDLRSLDIALGGQGAPIVPIGEKLLLGNYNYFLNIGGIANISCRDGAGHSIGYDICPANRVLNMLASQKGWEYDEGGQLAATGKIEEGLLAKLNKLDYYSHPYPKSLANDFGTAIVYPLIQQAAINLPDALRTYVEHIAVQVKKAVAGTSSHIHQDNNNADNTRLSLLVSGGGAFNEFLVSILRLHLQEVNTEIIIPDENLVKYKEALVMALIGTLRWRQENNTLSSVTGASRDSIGGALWNGQDA